MSGTPEAHYIIANMKHKKLKPRSDTVCAGHYLGTLMGEDVVVVTSGIGPTAAGLCTLELVTECGPWIKELIYFGTSGWSPQKGGILNPPQCDKAQSNNQTARCVCPVGVGVRPPQAARAAVGFGYPVIKSQIKSDMIDLLIFIITVP